MSGHNGHQLKSLSQRLNDNQQFKRRAKQMAKGTRVEELEKGLQGTQQAVVQAFMRLGDEYKKHTRRNYVFTGVNLAGLAGLAGHVFGWW